MLNRISSEIIGCSSVEDRGVVEMVSHRSPPRRAKACHSVSTTLSLVRFD